MPDLSTITSWPAAVVALGIVLTLQVPGLVSTMRTRRDTRVIRAQTENEHQDHPTPNLRAQMDAADERQERMAEDLGKLVTDFSRHVEQADAWQTAVERELVARRPWWRR